MIHRPWRRRTNGGQTSAQRVLDAVRVEWSPNGVIITPLEPRLTVECLLRAVSSIGSSGHSIPSSIVVDFTHVYELAGGWTIHFAILVDLGRRLRRPVRVRGLHDQPLDVAWLYRGDEEIRSLLGLSTRSPSQAA
jgi:hypothetical protein